MVCHVGSLSRGLFKHFSGFLNKKRLFMRFILYYYLMLLQLRSHANGNNLSLLCAIVTNQQFNLVPENLFDFSPIIDSKLKIFYL